MAVSRLKKIRLIAHDSFRHGLLEALQQSGLIHICDIPEEDASSGRPASNTHAQEEALSRLNFSLSFLTPYVAEEGMFEKLAAGKKVFSSRDLSALINGTDIDTIFEECTRINHNLKMIDQDIRHCEEETAWIANWKKLDCSIECLGETETSILKTCNLHNSNPDEFLNSVKETGLCVHCEVVDHLDSHTLLLIAAHKSDGAGLHELLEELEVEEVKLGDFTGTVAGRITALQDKIKGFELKKSELQEAAVNLLENRGNLQVLCDYFQNSRQKLEIQDLFQETSSAFVLEGWVKESKLDTLLGELRKRSSDWDYEILDTEETPPVAMENKPLFAPFEAITKLFGLPKYNETDPTPILAPYFFVFFGLCLADGGYGLILAGLAYWALKKFKLPENTRGMVKLGMYCGIATILAGAVTGSWFGDLANYLPFDGLSKFFKGLSLFDPINEPMVFMALALNLGVLHICTGLYTKFSAYLKNGEYADAFFGPLPWMVLFLVLELYWLISVGYVSPAVGPVLVWVIYFCVGALFFFGGRGTTNPLLRLGKGFLELYESIAYLSDVLSYSRLLALGLASAVIANVVNMISVLVSGVPYLGYVFLVALMLGGHTFNLAINTLGAFIHTSRLQFVEFFPKFFEGGGKEFTPFTRMTEYTHIEGDLPVCN